MTFEEDLCTLTETPSCFEKEAQVREYCADRLRSLRVTTECDGFGNLYAIRPGRRHGHAMLCAHMDKRMDANLLGPTGRDGEVPIGTSGVSCLVDEQRCRFFESHEGRFREISLVRDSVGHMAPLTGQAVPDQGADVYALPMLAESGGLLFGKFDDALGLALILHVFQETRARDAPTISALLTVGEERRLRGAAYAVRNETLYELNPGAIIVLDTCPKAEPGEGLILYEDCGRTRGDPTYSGTACRLHRVSWPIASDTVPETPERD